MTTASHATDVAVFIDFENIYISVRNRHDTNPNFESIMEVCQRHGRVIMARAYADWYRYPRVTNALYANGIEPMYVPTYHYDRDEGRVGRAIKNSVDMHLCIDLMKTLYAYDNIGTFVLVTGDRDFIPLINAVRQHGKHTVVIGVAEATASHLAQAADEFLYYDQVVDEPETTGTPLAEPYGALVDAIRTARGRGNVTTLAAVKLLMIEGLPQFDERRLTDRSGRPFAKFKDFVREAEHRQLVRAFTRGSVTELFLPDENPFAASQFAPGQATTPPGPAFPPGDGGDGPRAGDEEPSTDVDDDDALVLSETDWAVFEEAMRQFEEPVLFIQIYDALRDLRNKDIISLSNHAIKQMVKVAINAGLLVRSTHGPHAYYSLDAGRPFGGPEASADVARP